MSSSTTAATCWACPATDDFRAAVRSSIEGGSVVASFLRRGLLAGLVAGLAAVAFASAWLVPFLKYPSNPPGVGEASTISQRTRLYLAMVALSIATSVG